MSFGCRYVLFAVAIALAGCGGGGASTTPSVTGNAGAAPGGIGSSTGSNPKAAQSVQVNMHVPGSASGTSSSTRKPQFVASTTQGVLVTVYASSDTSHTTPLGSSATDVAPGAPACGGASGARTCTITIPAPPGQDDFIFITYDQPPSSGTTFPSNAHVLATGSVKNQTISAASANVVNVTLSGAIGTLLANPPVYSFAAGTGPHSYSVEVNAYDTDGNVIIGPYVDANGNPNPITVAVNPIGGLGYTTVSVGGSTPGLTATINSSTDVATIAYNGNSPDGYWVNLNIASASGVVVTSSFNPLFVSSTSPYFTGGANATLAFTASGQSATIGLFEANANTSFVDGSNCSNVAAVTQPGTGNTQSFTVTPSSAGGSCTIAITFAQATYTIAVTAPSNTTATVAVPGTTLAYLADGISGVQIRTSAGLRVGAIPTTASADELALDDAGNAYIGTAPNATTPGSVALYRPTGSGYPQAYANANVSYTLTAPNGLFYVSASGAGELVAMQYVNASFGATITAMAFDIWDPGKTGTPSRTIVIPAASSGAVFLFGALAHNGTLYTGGYTACGANTCVQYQVIPPGTSTPSRTFLESIVPQANQTGFTPNYATVGPDGTLYVTEWTFAPGDTNAGLYIYPPSGPERYETRGVSQPNGIDLDGNGNIYVVNDSAVETLQPDGVSYALGPDTAHVLTELAPDGTTQIKGVQVAPGSYPVTVSADGTTYVSALSNGIPNAVPGVSVILPNSYSATPIDSYGAYNVILYDGTSSTEPQGAKRAGLSVGSGTAHAGAFSLRHRH